MNLKSVPTRGRTLDHAAAVYDTFEPILLLGKQADYDRHLLSLLHLNPSDRVLDLGCGTGVLTRMIGDRLDLEVPGRIRAQFTRLAGYNSMDQNPASGWSASTRFWKERTVSRSPGTASIRQTPQIWTMPGA